MFRRFFVLIALIAFSTTCFAEAAKDFDIKGVIRFRLESDFVPKTTKMDYDFTYLQVTKTFGDNFSFVFAPGIIRSSLSVNSTSIKNDTLNFVVYAGNFKINDVTRGYGDYGISVVGGQYFSPFFVMEQYYQPFKFIEKPLDFKFFPNTITPLGFMVSKNFLENVIRASMAYVSGAGAWNSELYAGLYNDNVNAGGVHLMVSLFPFMKNESSAMKDLSLTVNIMSIARTTARSSYNLLLGYKYEKFATSFEYAGAYSSIATNKVSAMSVGASYDVWGPMQVLGRYDYADIKAVTQTFYLTNINNVFLLGLNTKWFDGHFQVATTYDQDYNPSTKATANRRFMLATQTNL